jgi:hypothetical protein
VVATFAAASLPCGVAASPAGDAEAFAEGTEVAAADASAAGADVEAADMAGESAGAFAGGAEMLAEAAGALAGEVGAFAGGPGASTEAVAAGGNSLAFVTSSLAVSLAVATSPDAFGLASSVVAVLASAACTGAVPDVLAAAGAGIVTTGALASPCGICGLFSALVSVATSDLAVSGCGVGFGASA